MYTNKHLDRELTIIIKVTGYPLNNFVGAKS